MTTPQRPLKGAWGITATQFGLLGSSFFFPFAVSAVIGGFLASRVPAKRMPLVVRHAVALPDLAPARA